MSSGETPLPPSLRKKALALHQQLSQLVHFGMRDWPSFVAKHPLLATQFESLLKEIHVLLDHTCAFPAAAGTRLTDLLRTKMLPEQQQELGALLASFERTQRDSGADEVLSDPNGLLKVIGAHNSVLEKLVADAAREAQCARAGTRKRRRRALGRSQ